MSAESTDDDRPSGLEATEVPSGPDTLPGVGAPGASADGRGRTIRPPVSDELRPGDVIGRYLIERKVGVGGMGEVYAAHDPQLDRRVAIKVLRPSSRAADAATRLVREAQALAKLAHPNVVAVYEVGEAAGRVFFAMQFVEGTTLGEHLASQRPRWAEIVSMYVAAGRGLAAAHAAGLIHRDVKPGNVLVDRHGHVAVTDFGVARAADDFATPEPAGPAWTGPTTSATGRSALSTDMTQAGAVIGTPAFMAPEQHAGQRATARSDQFSFCLSIWLGVFGVHPFVPVGHGEVTSPFEYMALVGEGALVPPPRRPHLPRRVIAALSRGLARDPDARWPSMTALLEQLEPRSGYRAAVVALAAVATVGAGAAVWFAVHGRAAAGPSCATTVAERVGTAWGPSRAAALVKTFATTGRPYAEVTAQAAAVALDQYARRWSALATDACAGGAAGGDGERAVAVARAQCLDRGLGALRAVTGMLADTARGELVDNALQVVAGLPDLGDCADPATLSAAGVPPAAQAGAVAALEARLATAKALVDAGLLREADRELAAMVAEVDAVGWVPLRVRVRVTLGENRLASFEPATALVATAASLATAHHLDRDAARAWATMIQLAGLARQPDAVAAYTEIAGAAAAATADPALIARVRTYHGRALSRMRRFAAAEPECRAALTEARARADVAWRDLAMARDCLLEAVVPLGKYPEAMALAEEGIAARSAQIGAEHPAIADYLSVLVRVKRGIGQTDEARAALARVQVIRERAFGPHHLKSAETLEDLAWFEADPGERQALLERALAIAVDPINAGPRQPMIEGSIVRSLADAAGREHDHVAMRRHFDRALALAEQVAGPVSIDVAMLLLGDGQYTSEVDLDQALVKLRRSVEILDQLKDGRITMARAAVALILTRAGRHAEAVPVLERALAELDDTSTEPSDLALLRQSLAEAIVATHGDRTRARALATAALAGYRSLGAEAGDSTAYVEGWLRRHR